jgi:hypothetical protein
MTTAPRRFESALENFPEYARLIGMVNVEIGNLEITLGLLLAAILNVHGTVGQTIYLTPKSAFARLEILENVVNMIVAEDGGGQANLLKIVERTKAALGKRHELIHGLWGITDGKVGIYAVPVVKDDAKPKPISIKYLKEVIRDIRGLVMAAEIQILLLQSMHIIRFEAGHRTGTEMH